MVNSKKDQNTEEKILQAAKDVFIQQGMAGARMQDIADRAGINKALLHYYFRSKEKLFEVVFAEAASQLIPRVGAILNTDEPLFKKIQTFCHDYIDFVIQNPFVPLFVINEMNKQSNEFLQRFWGQQKPSIQKFFMQIEEETKKGVIKPIHPHQLLTNILSLVVFPFIAKPMFYFMTDMGEKEYQEFMEVRKTSVANFIIEAIKK